MPLLHVSPLVPTVDRDLEKFTTLRSTPQGRNPESATPCVSDCKSPSRRQSSVSAMAKELAFAPSPLSHRMITASRLGTLISMLSLSQCIRPYHGNAMYIRFTRYFYSACTPHSGGLRAPTSTCESRCSTLRMVSKVHMRNKNMKTRKRANKTELTMFPGTTRKSQMRSTS